MRLIRDGEKGWWWGEWRGSGYGGGGRRRLYTYRYTVTTRMTSALRWAAIRAVLMFHNREGQSHKIVSTEHNFWRERRAEADSNLGPSAYQPNTLPLGQTGSQHTILGDCPFNAHPSITYYRRLQEETRPAGLSLAAISARLLTLHKPTKLLPFRNTCDGKRKWNGFEWFVCEVFERKCRVRDFVGDSFPGLFLAVPQKDNRVSVCRTVLVAQGTEAAVVCKRSFSCL